MSQSLSQVVGIDISKDHLDVHLYPDGLTCRISNDAAGLRRLLGWLEGKAIERIVYEATGVYHRLLEQALAKAGLPFAQVNPRQARRFAEATGRLVKTDRVDAAMLARLGALLQPEGRAVRSAVLEDLAELVAARRALVRERTRMQNRQTAVHLTLLRRQAAQRLRQIEGQIKAIDEACRGLVAAEPALVRRLAILMSIPAIGEATAMTLLADMPELGQLDHKQAASLAGLAPVTRQSGKWTGKSFIQGGRAHLRQALYMPALVALRYNAPLKAKYRQLVAAGKPAKVAITAVMRKLLILANALLRDGRKWEPATA